MRYDFDEFILKETNRSIFPETERILKNKPIGIIDNINRPKFVHGILDHIKVINWTLSQSGRDEMYMWLRIPRVKNNSYYIRNIEVYFPHKKENKRMSMDKKYQRVFTYCKINKSNRGALFYNDYDTFKSDIKKIADEEDIEFQMFLKGARKLFKNSI